jgi:hypothetical protein
VLDDQALRWSPTRHAAWEQTAAAGASVARTIVDWADLAPRRPADARDSFDPAYNFADLDEYVRWAQLEGIEVVFTLWGTPAWANGGAGPNVPPVDVTDFSDFAHAVAARYSGGHAGLPFVRFMTVWNEPNTPRFLRADDRVAAYATLLGAGYAGIKSGSPLTQVGAGETAASHAPAAFAAELAARFPDVAFDAWAHHPYPPSRTDGPDAPATWPGVGLPELARFSAELDGEFHRTSIPIWLTEYAESRPYVTAARQAADLERAVLAAASVPTVRMFVWLMLRNHRREPWQSGLAGRPSYGSFSAVAHQLDPRNPVVWWPGRALGVRVSALELRARLDASAPVAVSYSIAGCGRVVSGWETARIARDGWVTVTIPTRRPLRARAATLTIGDGTGRTVRRVVQLVGPSAAC